MTAQTPERLIIDGRPRALYAQPLYRLLTSRRMDLKDPRRLGFHTGCYRQYLGTWEIRNQTLYLMHLNMIVPYEEPITPTIRERLFRAVPATSFPIKAQWFNGKLRIAIGRRLVYSHQGWSHWFERERIITFKGGVVTRDREVDTKAILERQLKRDQEMRALLDGTDTPEDHGMPGPLVWFDNSDDDWTADWWPPDYRPAAGLGL